MLHQTFLKNNKITWEYSIVKVGVGINNKIIRRLTTWVLGKMRFFVSNIKRK